MGRQAIGRKVRGGSGCKKGLAYIADECQVLAWEKLSSSHGDNFANGHVHYKQEHLYSIFRQVGTGKWLLLPLLALSSL